MLLFFFASWDIYAVHFREYTANWRKIMYTELG